MWCWEERKRKATVEQKRKWSSRRSDGWWEKDQVFFILPFPLHKNFDHNDSLLMVRLKKSYFSSTGKKERHGERKRVPLHEEKELSQGEVRTAFFCEEMWGTSIPSSLFSSLLFSTLHLCLWKCTCDNRVFMDDCFAREGKRVRAQEEKERREGAEWKDPLTMIMALRIIIRV